MVGTATFIGGLLAAPIDFAVAPPPTAALLLAADGRQFATIMPPERRELVTAADIPQVMRDAIISAEDERFLQHSGVDPLATIRAAFRDLTGGVSQGGSTLTQQYVKNAYVGNERSALRKIREAALAVRLEQKLSKEAILTDYLNALYLGNGLYGVQAAAKYYFGVPVKDLDLNKRTGRRDETLALARASIMAGIAPAPSAWNPVKDFATARIRQQYTLNRMVVGGYASPQQASDAYQVDVHPLRISPAEPSTVAPEFADFVKGRLKASAGYDEDVFFRGGLRVKTTLDLDLQMAFNQALKEVLPDAKDPQAAIVAVDYRNGDVKAMATARRMPQRVDNQTGKVNRPAVKGYEQKLGFNLATNAQRSTGSTIKPFTLAEALLQGQTLSTSRYVPNCLDLPNLGKTYHFCNSDKAEAGTFSLRRALADSVNTVYVPLATEVGRGKVAALAQRAGLTGQIASGNLSFGLGAGVEVTPLSEAVAYGTLANGGVHTSPRTFTEIRTGAVGTDPGQVIERSGPSPSRRVLPTGVAAEVVSAMTDVVTSGTGTAARQPYTVFGKTGTTDDATDAWFTGCIPDQHICVATWMGYEDIVCSTKSWHVVGSACGGMRNLHGVKQVYGGTLPAKIFARAQEVLRQIKADRVARAAGLPTAVPTVSERPSAAPRATPAAAVPSRTAVPRPTRTLGPTTAPTSPPPVIVPPPPSPPPPSPSG
ncbi:MAG: pbpF 1 [Frankiales bacterium]|nr:pbpF 1 [Frankiales bacterium]